VKRVLGVCALVWGCSGAPRGDSVTLELANRADYLEARLEDHVLAPYVAANPDLRVVQQGAVTYQAAYRDRVLTSIVAGTPPDVFLLDNIDVPALVNRGALLDLTPYLARAGVDLGCLDQTVLSMFTRGDALYALPKGYTPLLVVYNKDLFDRAGIPYPTDDWTWDDFLRIAKRLTRDTDGDGVIDQWGTYFDRRPFLWIPWIWAGGGDVLCPDGRRASGCLDGPNTIAAIRWYTGWMTRYGIAPRAINPLKSAGDDFRLFSSGRIAMMTTGHSWVPRVHAYVAAGRLRAGFVAIPHRIGFRPVTVIYASGYAVPALVTRRKRSIELAAYLTDSLADALRGEAGLELPAVTAAARALVARDTLGWEAAFLRAATAGRAPWGARIERWREVEAALPDLMDRITLTGADPATAARELAREIDRLLVGIQ
jgi:multiple sugar transport system substrate-binding protein